MRLEEFTAQYKDTGYYLWLYDSDGTLLAEKVHIKSLESKGESLQNFVVDVFDRNQLDQVIKVVIKTLNGGGDTDRPKYRKKHEFFVEIGESGAIVDESPLAGLEDEEIEEAISTTHEPVHVEPTPHTSQQQSQYHKTMTSEQMQNEVRALMATEQNVQLVQENTQLKSKVMTLQNKVDDMREDRADLRIKIKELESDLKSKGTFKEITSGLAGLATEIIPSMMNGGSGLGNVANNLPESGRAILDWMKNEEGEESIDLVNQLIQLAEANQEFGKELGMLVVKYTQQKTKDQEETMA